MQSCHSYFFIDYIFKSNSSFDEVQKFGLYAGDNIYVGAVTHKNKSIPAMLWSGGCHFVADGKEIIVSIESCAYLVNKPGLFQWISSSNGTVESGAVTYGSAVIGKGILDPPGIMRIGEISLQQQSLIVGFGGDSMKLNNYQALIYLPHQKLPVPGKYE